MYRQTETRKLVVILVIVVIIKYLLQILQFIYSFQKKERRS